MLYYTVQGVIASTSTAWEFINLEKRAIDTTVSGATQTWDCEIFIDPDPLNSFWRVYLKYYRIHICRLV